MTIDQSTEADEDRKKARISMDRHATTYRTEFAENTDELHAKCPVAWNDTHDGYWYVSGNKELFDLARRADILSNDADIFGKRKGYRGISIPTPPGQRYSVGGFLEMDPPEQREYRNELNPYLSPAAVARWQPFIDDFTRACIDEVIESGTVDFVDDLANIVPAILTMAMLGLPLKDWVIYCEPIHAAVYTSPDSPDYARISTIQVEMGMRLIESMGEIRETHRPGLINQLLDSTIVGEKPDDMEIMGVIMLIVGGGFDTTTALTAHALEWLSENPDQRDRLIAERETLLDSATEEFLRYYTPAQGDGRTISQDCEIDGTEFKEGERLWLSWAMANRDETVFENPHEIVLDRPGNRHSSFGLGIHRCIGSNVARVVFKSMLMQALERMPDYVCEASGAVHYDSIGVINGMKKLPATFTPGQRTGDGLQATMERWQAICDEEGLAEPLKVTERRAARDA